MQHACKKELKMLSKLRKLWCVYQLVVALPIISIVYIAIVLLSIQTAV